MNSFRSSTRKRMLEVCLVLALIAIVALFFGHRQRSQAELDAEEKSRRQAKELVDSTSEVTAHLVKNGPALFVEGLKMAYDPMLDLQYTKLNALNSKLARTPDDTNSLRERAGVYYKLEFYEDGLTDAERVIELEPDNAYNYYGRYAFYTKLKQYELALADLETCAKMTEELGSPFFNSRAYTLAKLGRFEEAMTDAEKSISSKRNTYNLDTLGYILVGLQRYEEAVVAYDEAIQLDPESHYALRGRAVALRQLGRIEASMADLEAARRLKHDFCLHWVSEFDPGEHNSEDKSILEASFAAAD